MTRIIYDLGANHGQNIEYYLLKADRVIAVEANPELAENIRNKFNHYIDSGRLTVIQAAVTVDPPAPVKFYISNNHDVLSQLCQPEHNVEHFSLITVESVNIIDLIREHGEPYYIKIDIEHYDHIILRCLMENNICPPFISAEAHNPVIPELLHNGGYKRYKFIRGAFVEHYYGSAQITDQQGCQQPFKFIDHSAGPFGEDVLGKWMTYEELMQEKDNSWNPGWVDIHCAL